MHKIKRRVQQKQESRILPFTPVHTYFLLFLMLYLLPAICAGSLLTTRSAKHSAQATQQNAAAQIPQRIDEPLKLLNSLAVLPEFYDPFVKWEEEVEKLDSINIQFGCMFICYVDESVQAYTPGEESANLAVRKHMQKLYATKQPIVTDSFVIGADGVTLNYTVAVPLLQDGVMTGGLFCSIYFDDTVELLEKAASVSQSEAVLTSSEGQIMSSANGLSCGSSYVGQLQDVRMYSMMMDTLGTKLLVRESGVLYSGKDGNLVYIAYGSIKNTNRNILITIDFFRLFLAVLPRLLLIAVITAATTLSLHLLVRAYSRQRKANMESMVAAIHRMERKLYKNSTPEQMDYDDLLQMSSTGLRDGLTDVVTRMVFLSRMQKLLKSGEYGSCMILCFVDPDGLKTLNDIYGHQAGDSALRKIGFILREYEVKYEGIFGRYGGDEFAPVLNDVSTVQEVYTVLSELVEKLNFSVTVRQKAAAVHCSIGACIWNKTDSLDVLIAKADKALCDVKWHDKKAYSPFLKGGS